MITDKIRVFTLLEAREILPLVYFITDKHSKEVKKLMELARREDLDQILSVQDSINQVIEKWQQKMQKLGLNPRGLWLLDMDSGSGYYCWKYPEKEIIYHHEYYEGFMDREKIST